MNIWIESNALEADRDEYLFRSGTLYALKHLQEAGHILGWNTDSLSKSQKNLLKQEYIKSSIDTPDQADRLIHVTDGKLRIVDTGSNEVEEADSWLNLRRLISMPSRKARNHRTTGETDITVYVNLDGTGRNSIHTGLSFFDHMLEQIARHGLIDLDINCDGDLHVDEHHTIEDVAIALGEALNQAMGDKRGIRRYAFVLPMDESRATIALDLSGRPYLVFDGAFDREYVGDFPTEMVEHFFYSLAIHLKATLHLEVQGSNDHHKIEACFKGLAQVLREAFRRSERTLNTIPSSKGTL